MCFFHDVFTSFFYFRITSGTLHISGDIFYMNCFVMFSQASFIFASLQALFTFPETSFTWIVSWCFHKLLLFLHHLRHSSHFRRHLLHELFFDVFTSFFYFRITSGTLHISGDIFYMDCFVMFSQASFIFASLQALFTFPETSLTLTVSRCFHKLLLFSHHFMHSSHFRRHLLHELFRDPKFFLIHSFIFYLHSPPFTTHLEIRKLLFILLPHQLENLLFTLIPHLKGQK